MSQRDGKPENKGQKWRCSSTTWGKGAEGQGWGEKQRDGMAEAQVDGGLTHRNREEQGIK